MGFLGERDKIQIPLSRPLILKLPKIRAYETKIKIFIPHTPHKINKIPRFYEKFYGTLIAIIDLEHEFYNVSLHRLPQEKLNYLVHQIL